LRRPTICFAKSIQIHALFEQQRWLYLLVALAAGVNCSGLCIPILGPDGALYASIAKTMVQRNNYLELFAYGHDWLDKPHFSFWITALSFKLCGFQTWAYKLPAILCLMMGAWYTYLFAKQLYNRQVALWSVIILLTAEHIILSNNDVRAEPYLTGLIMAAVYHFYRAHSTQKSWPVIMGALFAACAVMTKGLVALVPIGGAITGECLIKKQWQDLWHRRWVFAVLLILLCITPELYCLYAQFDAHPEKIVFGRTGVSGIRFFFWDSQFGRFMNTGPIKGHGDPLFFLHTTLWAFLPWSVMFYVAVFTMIKTNRHRAQEEVEWYTIAGAGLTFLLFSASRFQLPHYINIIFPFFAIITAWYLSQITSPTGLRFLTITQYGLISLFFLLIIFVHIFVRPGKLSWWIWILFSGLIVLIMLCGQFCRHDTSQRILSRTALAAVAFNCYLNLGIAPWLLRYQAGSEAAFYSNQYYPGVPVVQLQTHGSSPLAFYLKQPLTTLQQLTDTDTIMSRPYLLYAPTEELQGIHGQLVHTFNFFPISRLTPQFLFYKTRGKVTTAYGLLLRQ
jgi:4-amino-4-deoxy-L-arabinose transferase-like glycosyltransferase